MEVPADSGKAESTHALARDPALLDELPLPVFLYDVENLSYLAVNQAAVDHYGYSREEFLRMKVTDIRPPNEVQRLLATLGSLDTMPRHLGVWRHRKKDGTIVLMDIFSKHSVGPGGRPARLIVATDVTEQKRAEEALRQSEAKLAQAQKLARIGSWEWDPQTGEIRWSAEVYRMLGLPNTATPTLELWTSLLHPDDRAKVREQIQKALAGGPYDLEMRFLLPAGELIGHALGEVRMVDGLPRMFGTLQDVTERRRLQRMRFETEERLRAAFKVIPDALNIGRLADGVNININEGFERLTGWNEAEAVGRPASELNLWVDAGERDCFFDRLRRQGVVRNTEVRLRAKDGSEFVGLVSSQVFDLAGQPHFLSVTRDITEQKRAEHAQAAVYRIAEAVSSSDSLHDMLESIHQIVGGLMPAPNLFIALYEEETQQLSFPYYFDELDTPPVGPVPLGRGLTEYVLRTGQSLVLDAKATRRLVESGEVAQVGTTSASWIGVPLRSGQRTVGVLAAQIYSGPARYGERDRELLQFVSSQVARAIERKQADDVVRRSEQRFRALIENTSDGICIIDATGKVLYRSPAIDQILGYPPGELEGDSIGDYIHPEDQQAVFARLAEVTQRPGVPLLTQARVRRKDGSIALLEGVATNRLNDPAVGGIVLNVRDLTERKQMEARLMMADRMVSVGTLAAGVAHEINNPLAYVMANLGFLADALSECATAKQQAVAPEMLEALRDAQDGAERVRKIVRDLKTFSRADESSEGPVDLHRVLDAAINMAWNELRHRARLVKDYAVSLPLVSGNESKLGQVFLNLIINAAQAIPEGRAEENEIRITTRVSRGLVVVDVRDSGSGISSENLGRLFDPFFTTKPVGVGTGLGLFICQNIVTANGGEITVESEPGKGTVFHVSLKLASGIQPRADKRDALAAAPSLAARVLIIDDEPLLGGALRRQLTGHEVVTEVSARAALERLRRGERFDVIFCDLMMPDMTGVTFHEELSAEAPALARQVVFMTGGAFTTAARDFFERVPNARMEKPLSLQNVRALIEDRLRRARA